MPKFDCNEFQAYITEEINLIEKKEKERPFNASTATQGERDAFWAGHARGQGYVLSTLDDSIFAIGQGEYNKQQREAQAVLDEVFFGQYGRYPENGESIDWDDLAGHR